MRRVVGSPIAGIVPPGRGSGRERTGVEEAAAPLVRPGPGLPLLVDQHGHHGALGAAFALAVDLESVGDRGPADLADLDVHLDLAPKPDRPAVVHGHVRPREPAVDLLHQAHAVEEHGLGLLHQPERRGVVVLRRGVGVEPHDSTPNADRGGWHRAVMLYGPACSGGEGRVLLAGARVPVVLVGRHRSVVIATPLPLLDRELPQRRGHRLHVAGHRAAARSDVLDAEVAGLRGERAHRLPGQLERVEGEGKRRRSGEVRLIVGGPERHGLGGNEAVDGRPHLGGDREGPLGVAKAVDADHVGARVAELPGAVGRGAPLVGPRLLLERHRDHGGQPGAGGPLLSDQGLAEPRVRLAEHQVDPLVHHHLELAIEHRPDALGGARILRVVHPCEAEVARHQGLVAGDLAGDPDRGPVDVVDLVGQPDRGQLVLAGVEREGLEDLRPGPEELAVELGQRLGVGQAHLGRERAGPDVPALLQLEQVATVAEDGALGQPLQETWRGHRRPHLRRSRSTAWAALWPGAPVTPPPGWAPAPHRYSRSIGVRYRAHPGTGRMKNSWSIDRSPWKMFPSVSPYVRSRSRGVSTCRATTDLGTFGAYSAIVARTRSPNSSRFSSQVPSRRRYGTNWTKQVITWRPAGARVGSTLEATTQSTHSRSGISPR